MKEPTMSVDRGMRGALVALAAAALFAHPAVAQTPDPAAAAESIERMAALSHMVGEWHGSGWIMTRTVGRHEFTGCEHVEYRLGGRVLLIEGLHRGRMPGVDTPVVVHHALGVITWDAHEDRYVFHTWLGNQGGGGAINELEASDDGIRWWPQSASDEASVVFNVAIREEMWLETGEVELPNGQRMQIFEMRLEKQ